MHSATLQCHRCNAAVLKKKPSLRIRDSARITQQNDKPHLRPLHSTAARLSLFLTKAVAVVKTYRARRPRESTTLRQPELGFTTGLTTTPWERTQCMNQTTNEESRRISDQVNSRRKKIWLA